MFSKILVLGVAAQLVAARTFTVYNACPFTIWPAVYTDPSKGSAVPLVETGWEAMPQTSKTFYVPGAFRFTSWRCIGKLILEVDNWAAGRIWGRRGCNFWNVQGPTSCLTGGMC